MQQISQRPNFNTRDHDCTCMPFHFVVPRTSNVQFARDALRDFSVSYLSESDYNRG